MSGRFSTAPMLGAGSNYSYSHYAPSDRQVPARGAAGRRSRAGRPGDFHAAGPCLLRAEDAARPRFASGPIQGGGLLPAQLLPAADGFAMGPAQATRQRPPGCWVSDRFLWVARSPSRNRSGSLPFRSRSSFVLPDLGWFRKHLLRPHALLAPAWGRTFRRPAEPTLQL